MNDTWRYVAVAALLIFAWRGDTVDLEWPPDGSSVTIPRPDPVLLAWTDKVKPIAAGMLPKDREYLANLYDAMGFVLLRDSGRGDDAIISTTSKFAGFHESTLRLAIDRKAVGKYPGLAEAIDSTFMRAIGDDQRAIEGDDRTKLIGACNALAWTFKIHGE